MHGVVKVKVGDIFPDLAGEEAGMVVDQLVEILPLLIP
jgi:hypothetical protein